MSWKCPISNTIVTGEYNGDAEDDAFIRLGCMDCTDARTCKDGPVFTTEIPDAERKRQEARDAHTRDFPEDARARQFDGGF